MSYYDKYRAKLRTDFADVSSGMPSQYVYSNAVEFKVTGERPYYGEPQWSYIFNFSDNNSSFDPLWKQVNTNLDSGTFLFSSWYAYHGYNSDPYIRPTFLSPEEVRIEDDYRNDLGNTIIINYDETHNICRIIPQHPGEVLINVKRRLDDIMVAYDRIMITVFPSDSMAYFYRNYYNIYLQQNALHQQFSIDTLIMGESSNDYTLISSNPSVVAIEGPYLWIKEIGTTTLTLTQTISNGQIHVDQTEIEVVNDDPIAIFPASAWH